MVQAKGNLTLSLYTADNKSLGSKSFALNESNFENTTLRFNGNESAVTDWTPGFMAYSGVFDQNRSENQVGVADRVEVLFRTPEGQELKNETKGLGSLRV